MSDALARVIAAVRTGAAYAIVSIYTLIVGPPGMVLALVFNWPNVLYGLGKAGVRLGFALLDVRYTVEGSENLLRDRAAVYCVNHTSNLDPPLAFLLLSPLFPRVQVLYKAVLRKIPVLGRCFEIAGFVPVNRSSREQSRQAIERAVRQLRDGNSFMTFPEGTRSRTGQLLPFKKGVFLMAIEAGAPVVPVAILGARDAMRKGSALIWPARVRMRVGPALETAALSPEDRDELLERAHVERSPAPRRLTGGQGHRPWTRSSHSAARSGSPSRPVSICTRPSRYWGWHRATDGWICRPSSGSSTTPGSSASRWCCMRSSSLPTRCPGSTRCGTEFTPPCARSAGHSWPWPRSATRPPPPRGSWPFWVG